MAQTENIVSLSKPKSAPHSVEAEQALLGSIFLNNNVFHELEGLLKPADFYVQAHGTIFEAIIQIMDRGFVADPVTIADFIGPDALDKIGGNGFLMDIAERATTIINTKSYAKIIHNHAIERQLIDVGTQLVNRAYNPEGVNPDDLINHAEAELFSIAEGGQTNTSYVSLKEPLVNVIEQLEKVRASDAKITGVTSGFRDVDNLLGGWQPSELIILAARPSMGKTAFALNAAYNAAKALANNIPGGAGVAVFSLEMSAEQLATRVLSSASQINMSDMAQGNVDGEKFGRLVQASDELSRLNLFIDDTPQLHISALRSRARRLKRQHNIGMIVIDYLQLMRGNADNRVQEVSEISQGLKGIARELNIPVIALSQLSRSVENRENKRPQLSDLRESGSIEQDADVVTFLYREDYYLEKKMGANPTPEDQKQLEEIRGLGELLISKNRKGATSAVRLVFDGPKTTFKDYAKTDYEIDTE